MYRLKEKFRLNGLRYILLNRNEVVALYGILGSHTDEILHYEVSKIYIRKDKYGIREALPTNEKFGNDRSRCYKSRQQSLEYFEKLTDILKLGKGVAKTPTGVEENCEAILSYA